MNQKLTFKTGKLFFLFTFFILSSQLIKAANFYWVGGTGNWSDFANHWATTSGGTTYYTYSPTLLDNIFFDSNSFTAYGQEVSLNVTQIYCNDFTFNGNQGMTKLKTVSGFGNSLIVYGNFYIGANSNLICQKTISLQSSNINSIVSIQDTVDFALDFNNPTGTWNFTYPLVAKKAITLTSGGINTNNHNWALNKFDCPGSATGRSINSGSSTITLTSFDGTFGSSGPSYDASWMTNLYVTSTGANTDFVFKMGDISLYDTTGFGNTVYTYFGFSNHGNFKSITGLAYGKVGNWKYLLDLQTYGTFYLTNSVFTTNAKFACNGDFFSADSVICTGIDVSTMLVFINFSDSISINYLYARKLYLGLGKYAFVNKIEVEGEVEIGTGINPFGPPYYQFNHIESGGDVSVGCGYGPTHIGYLSTKGIMGEFKWKVNVDTLVLNRGGAYTLLANDTLKVNDYFIARGDGGLPLQLKSATSGTTANLLLGQTAFCGDYLYVKDINVIGTNVVAGANSTNAGNNSGWQFTSCTSTSDVWAGDANYDLVVNNFDLLNIGVAYNETGPVRSGASLSWVAQPADDWSGYFTATANYKHADTNGDGLVNDDDTLAISQNYGLTHPFRMASIGDSIYALLKLTLAMPPSLVPGNTYTLPINLGKLYGNIIDIYGLAFTLGFNPTAIVPGSVSVSFTNSWMNTGPNLFLQNNSATSNSVAFTRTDQLNISGYGTIAEVTFTVSPSAGGNIDFTFQDIRAIDSRSIQLPIGGQNSSTPTGIASFSNLSTLLIYPNPAKNQFKITGLSEGEVYTLNIYDVMGRKIITQQLGNNAVVHTSEWAYGIYMVELMNSSEYLKAKIIKE